jgi:hypothetical protein
VPTDVTIQLWADQLSGETFDVSVEVCVEPGGTGKTMRVHVVQSLATYPTSRAYNRNTVMQGLDGVDITVTADACQTVVQTITFDPASWALADQIQLTAWAQDPATVAPAEVHQAKQVLWPFTHPDVVFVDGFEDGTTGGWTAVTPE